MKQRDVFFIGCILCFLFGHPGVGVFLLFLLLMSPK